MKTNETIDSTSEHRSCVNPSEAESFCLDEFIGHVDHIQSSLDHIREFMFNKLSDDTIIDDLFNEEHVLLSPLIPPTSNLLTNDAQEQQLNNDLFYSSPLSIDKKRLVQSPSLLSSQTTVNTDDCIRSRSISNVDNQLLQQLIEETAKMEEQRHQIKRLQHEHRNLQDEIHLFAQQTRK
jgi:hypothetical protein